MYARNFLSYELVRLNIIQMTPIENSDLQIEIYIYLCYIKCYFYRLLVKKLKINVRLGDCMYFKKKM